MPRPKKNQESTNENLLESTDSVAAGGSGESGGVDVHIVEPDDVVPAQKKTAKENFLDFIGVKKDSSTSEHDTPKKKPGSGGGRKKKFTAENYTMMIASFVAVWVGSFFDDMYKECAPTSEQLDAMLKPLARIYDRHAIITDVNPDVVDTYLCLYAVIMYGINARATYVLIKLESEKQKDAERQNQNPTRDFFSFDPTATGYKATI